MSNLNIDDITKNQKFQNATDELIEEKNRQDEAIKEASNYLYNQNMDQIAQIIESQNTYTEEEQQYMNSSYYANYQNIINNLDTLIMQPIYDLNYKYIYNHMQLDNPLVKKVETCLFLNAIGYPVPELFIEELKQAVYLKLNELNKIEGTYHEVEIVPIEYVKDSSNERLVRKIDSYQVIIKLKKEKNKTKVK